MPKAEAVIFDLDRTLLDLKQSEYSGLQQLLTELNVEIDFDEFYQTYSKINEHWWHQRSIGKANSEDVRKNRFRDSFNQFGIELSIDLMEVNERYFAIASQHWVLYPSVENQLKKLKETELKLGIITSFVG